MRVDSSLPSDDLMDPLDDASIELGPIYRPATDEPPLEDPRNPTGRPGVRAPHLPLERNGEPISTHDLLGDGFVLLTGPDGRAWCDAAASVAASRGVPLKAHSVAATGPLVDKEDRFTDVYGIGPGGAVLVRPDRVVAWRTAEPADDPQGTIDDVMNRNLFRASTT
jgi:hypothetical protein